VIPQGRALAGWHLAFTGAAFALFQFLCVPNMQYVPVIMALSALLTAWYMWDFKDSIMKTIRKKPEGVIDRAAFFIGHHSLEIFVIHLLLFKLVAWYMYSA
jgi:uncharacterized membrane protein YhfC